jgi:hypothetical protein
MASLFGGSSYVTAERDGYYRRTNFCNEWHSGDTSPRFPPADHITSAT